MTFPDLPGCATTGATLHAALATAPEALASHIEALLKDGKPVPLPSLADAVERGDAVVMTTINVPDNLRAARFTVSIPALLLSRFDSFAERRGTTRANLLVEALQRFMAADAAPPAQAVRADPYNAVFSAIAHMRNIGDPDAPPADAGAHPADHRRCPARGAQARRARRRGGAREARPAAARSPACVDELTRPPRASPSPAASRACPTRAPQASEVG